MHAEPPTAAGRGRHWSDLPQDLLADIRGRLNFTDRLAFTAVFGDLFFPEAPWLIFPEDPVLTYYKTMFFSLADRLGTTVRSLPLHRNDVLLGSSRGWLAMADNDGLMHLVNPVTGQQHALPAITTMVGLNVSRFSNPCNDLIYGFHFEMEDFLAIRFSGRPYPECWRPVPYRSTVHMWSNEMRNRVYRKVVLSASAGPRSYAAMLMLAWKSYIVPAFATAEDPVWRVASPRDDVVDAVHHRGRFYSLGRSGVVEVWNEKELTSEVVASRLAGEGDKQLVTTPEGRLVAVFWDVVYSLRKYGYLLGSSKCSFKVQVLDEASGNWQETDDIGQAAVLVGAENNVMCVSTRGHQNLTENCVYFTDEVEREVRVYSLRQHTLTKIDEFEVDEHWWGLWKAAAWFTPSFP